MNQVTESDNKVKCAECEEIIDTSIDTEEEKAPCPKCGSQNRAHELSFDDELLAVDGYGVKGKRPGQKKPFVEEKSGPDYSHSRKKLVRKERLIDRDNNKYYEIVTDYQSGEVIHHCEEPLTDHYGHGSAKARMAKK